MSRRNPHIQIRTCAFCVLALSVLGCSSTRQPKVLDQLYGGYEQKLLNKYKNAESVPVADKAERNEVMNDLLLLIDHQFYRTEAGLYARKAFADFGTDVVITGLGTAGALTGGAETKSVLAALIAALQGTRTSFDKDILQGRSMIAIVTQMRKMRATKLVQIRKRMNDLDIDTYPLSFALVDLLEYQQSGTFLGALQGLTEEAAAGKHEADVELNKTLGSFERDDASTRLRAFYKPAGTINTGNQAKLRAWMDTHGFSEVMITEFLFSKDYRAARKEAAAELAP